MHCDASPTPNGDCRPPIAVERQTVADDWATVDEPRGDEKSPDEHDCHADQFEELANRMVESGSNRRLDSCKSQNCQNER